MTPDLYSAEGIAAAASAGRTVAILRCVGLSAPGCGAEVARVLWPWSGAAVVESSTVCPGCAARERERIVRSAP